MTGANHTSKRVRERVKEFLGWSSSIFLLVGALAIGYAAYVDVAGQAYQAIELRKFKAEVPLFEPRVLEIGEAMGQIQIPSVGLQAVILNGDSPKILRLGVGHLPETAMPGEPGNVGLAAHRDTFFRPLRRIQTGDIITLRTHRGRFQYRVQSTSIVSPRDIGVLRPSNRNELTLVTCFPFDYVGPAPNRFVVHAVEIVPSSE
ncbi:MAG: class D sortase [Candidatus Acidiferrum sp.]